MFTEERRKMSTNSNSELVGVWDLEQYDIISKNNLRKTLNGDIRGRLTYTSDGHVFVVIVRHGGDWIEGKNPCYSGRYYVKGDVVEHQIHVSTIDRYVDSIQKRKFIISENKLVLLYESDQLDRVHEVVWKKIE